MREYQGKFRFVLVRIIGVLVAVLLIAGIALAAFRFGQQRGLLAISEAAVMSSDVESAMWAGPFMYWHRFSVLGSLLIVLVAIFLLRMMIGFIIGPGPHFRGYRCRRWRHHRWSAPYPCCPYDVPKETTEESERQADAAVS